MKPNFFILRPHGSSTTVSLETTPFIYYARRFANIPGAFDLKQHVRGITHKDGDSLDLVTTKSDDSLVCKKYKGL